MGKYSRDGIEGKGFREGANTELAWKQGMAEGRGTGEGGYPEGTVGAGISLFTHCPPFYERTQLESGASNYRIHSRDFLFSVFATEGQKAPGSREGGSGTVGLLNVSTGIQREKVSRMQCKVMGV